MTTSFDTANNWINQWMSNAISVAQRFLWSRTDPHGTYYDPYLCADTEPVIELIKAMEAWIVKNRRGRNVLITPCSLPMIDIDFKDHVGLEKLASNDEMLMTWLKCRHQQLQDPHRLRVYRTQAGVRLLVESGKMLPRSAAFATLAKNLGCDSLYLALCQKQNCYRIRLTPKSDTNAIRPRTCRFIGILGEDLESCNEVQELIQIHDIRTGALDSAGGLLLG